MNIVNKTKLLKNLSRINLSTSNIIIRNVYFSHSFLRNYSTKVSPLSERYQFNGIVHKDQTLQSKNNIITNINVIKEFSFQIQNTIQKADDLVAGATKISIENNNTDNTNSLELIKTALKLYIETLPQSKSPIEKGLIYFRISSCRFRLGLLSKAQEDVVYALSMLPLSNRSDNYRVLSLMACYFEHEYDLQVNKQTEFAKELYRKSLDTWNKVIEFSSSKPDGYIGVARMITKSYNDQDIDIPKCFMYAEKALLCDSGKQHPPTLLFASEMMLMQEKDNLSLALLNNFFKYYKEFYSTSFIYRITGKDLAEGYFRRGVCNYNFQKFNESIQDFTESISRFKYLISLSENSKPSSSNNNQIMFYKNDLVSSYYFRGKSFKFKSQHKEAVEDFNYVIQEKDQLESFDESLKESLVKVYSERADSLRTLGGNIKQALSDQKIFDDHKRNIQKQKEASVESYIRDKKEKVKKEKYLERIGYYDEDFNYDEDEEKEEEEE